MDTSTPPSITLKYGSLRGNVSDTRNKYNAFVFTCSDMRLRRSREDNVSMTLSNDGEELTDGNGRVVACEDVGNKEFRFSRFVVD
jgi:hypothetical protein